jgi:two-component system, chemotaxis family, sensor kinase CheA
MSNESSASVDFDMSELHGLFFDEATEHLDAMEALLIDIDVATADDEQLNAIFRAAHSIKGGAATFGFTDITELTHEMETVFDRVRKGHMPLSTELVDVFLASGDTLKAMLSALKGDGAPVPADDVTALCTRLRVFLDPTAAQIAATAAAPAPAAKPVLELVFAPLDDSFNAAAVDSVVADLKDFGSIEEIAAPGAAQPLTERRFRITTEVSAEDLNDSIAFMADPERVKVVNPQSAQTAAPASVPAPVAAPVAAEAPAAPAPAPADDSNFGLFVDAATLPVNQPDPVIAKPAETKVVELKTAAKPPAAQHGAADATSIRVSVEKVDQLINLVGELVITQAMLAQTASHADPVLYEALFNGLATLERNTRDLQESAMSIRMMPMSIAFSRFPRVVRDVAAKLGKEVELITSGEHTELDKGLIERIVDPLTHLVRNSLDHGLETPAEREAKGKPRKGTIKLSAYHQGGAIVIEVSDDGRGLHRDKILAKAKERGMDVSDSMSDTEVWQLIFEAGFSTADKVTDVSGRGVGMDVVRRNILALGGRVDIQSTADIGTRITIKLPLTLAILDGMSVRVGNEVFIMPLGTVSESLQPEAGAINTINGRGQVLSVRGEYVPVISLAEIFGIHAEKTRFEEGILVILEAEGGKTALFVDDLVGQHQVVIKSLETNYRKVAGVSGATIMGDGRVAMILDVAYIVGLAHSRLDKAA